MYTNCKRRTASPSNFTKFPQPTTADPPTRKSLTFLIFLKQSVAIVASADLFLEYFSDTLLFFLLSGLHGTQIRETQEGNTIWWEKNVATTTIR